MHKSRIAIWTAALAVAATAWAKPPIPRPAAELTIVETSGKQTLLTSQKGEVVLVQFLFTNCVHCQATARTFSKLQKEYGPRGLKVFGVAFNDDVQSTPELVQEFIKSNNVTFPVGVAPRDTVMSYLGISVMERMAVPQVLVVDRKGVVRAQSDAMGSAELQDEAHMRALLEGLLKESTPNRTAAPKIPAAVTVAAGR